MGQNDSQGDGGQGRLSLDRDDWLARQRRWQETARVALAGTDADCAAWLVSYSQSGVALAGGNGDPRGLVTFISRRLAELIAWAQP